MTSNLPAPNGGDLNAKLKHLEFIQGVIGRMSTSSFLFKGWAITIAVGLSSFAATKSHDVLRVALIGALASTVLFWGLDAYYLWIEHRYVALYREVSKKEPAEINFAMDTDKSAAAREWFKRCLRPHLVFFYGVIFIGEAIGLYLIRGK